MSRVFRTLAVLTLLVIGVDAQDDSPWYVTFGGGAHTAGDTDGPAGSTISFDGGYSVSLGIGRYIHQTNALRLSVQGELLFNNFELSDEDVSSLNLNSDKAENLSLMLNGVADCYLAPQFAVYAALGIGYVAQLNVDGLDQPGMFTLEDSNVPAFQFKTGFKYGLGGGYDVNLGYRYFRMAAAEVSSLTSQTFDLEFDQHILEVVLHWGI